MKKIISFALVLFMLATVIPLNAAFTDIPSERESVSAETLATLGIVNGTGGNSFNPSGLLTRAEFCKMAVLSAGFNEEGLYKSYTRFSDVPSSQWYAPYVNAAVKKYNIIKGNPDGSFAPNGKITYGEALTILVRMLGYEDKDVGYFWPTDHIAKANKLGLEAGLNKSSVSAPVTRGQAAIMLCNLLLSMKKDGTLFISSSYTADTTSSIMLATPATDPTLNSSQVKVLTSEVKIVNSDCVIPNSFVGLRGVCVYNSKGQLKGFIPRHTGYDTITVKSTSGTAITAKDGSTITIPRSVKVVYGNTITEYPAAYYDIKPNSEINIYYTEGGIPEIIFIRSSSMSYSSTAVYGIDNIVFQNDYKIVKNGVEVTRNALETYDVVSNSTADKTYYVSDHRISLLWEKAGITYTNPTWIEAGGKKFDVSESAAKYFEKLTINTVITLLFDASGNLAGALPTNTVSGNAQGILEMTAETEGTFKTFWGLELKGTTVTGPFVSGQLYTMTQSKSGKLMPACVKYDRSRLSTFDTLAGTYGVYKLAPNALIFEQANTDMPIMATTLGDLKGAKILASNILHTELNSAGQISLIVVSDTTFSGYTFGLLKQAKSQSQVGSWQGAPVMGDSFEVSIVTSAGQKVACTGMLDPKLGERFTPGAIATGAIDGKTRSSVPAFKLKSSATVGRDAFDALNKTVFIGSSPIAYADKVEVFVAQSGKSITLTEARANYTAFELFCDKDPGAGGTVRVILAK